MNDPVKPARKPRLTVEDAWPYSRQLLVLADDADKRDILTGYRNAANAAALNERAYRLEGEADACRIGAKALIDDRTDVLARLKARAADLTK